MAKKLFVGSLAYSVTDEQLQDFFAQAGTVDTAKVVMDRFSGRSRGFGFVEMSNDEEAQKAVDTLNGQELEGRAIVVNEARPMTDRPRRTGGDHGGSGGFRGRRDF